MLKTMEKRDFVDKRAKKTGKRAKRGHKKAPTKTKLKTRVETELGITPSQNPNNIPPITCIPTARIPGAGIDMEAIEAVRQKIAKESYERNQEIQAYNRNEQSVTVRDIAPLPSKKINWERRLRAKEDYLYYCKTYYGATFNLDWADNHHVIARKIAQCCSQAAFFAVAMPRGSGKTSLCRTGVLWAVSYGFKRFCIAIGSAEDKALQTLYFIKQNLCNNILLLQDFPEIAYPMYKMFSKAGRFTPSQLYNRVPTALDVKSDIIRLPNLLLTEEEAKCYLDNDPSSVKWCEAYQAFLPASNGSIIKSVGIGGSLRGDALAHPITLETLRPDFVLLDDIQKDIDAKNHETVMKTVEVIDGAIRGMEGPDVALSIVFPCTVIQEEDVSCQYLDHDKHPEYQGERCKMVNKWPLGMTEEEIDKDSEIGSLWIEYQQLRNDSLSLHGNIVLATEFYRNNQKKMDEGFDISWPDRYPRNKGLLSAIQYAMELRFSNLAIFLAEYQQKGKSAIADAIAILPPKKFAAKQHAQGKGIIPLGCSGVTAFLDVQEEMLFYCVIAFKPDLTTYVIDYGTFPEVPLRTFTKREANSWNMLTNLFWRDYPETKADWLNAVGKQRANKEAKIYHGLALATRYMAEKVYHLDNDERTPKQITKIGIDTRGTYAEAIKRFGRDWSSGVFKVQGKDTIIQAKDYVVPMAGRYISPAEKQFEEYTPTTGWIFENNMHPHVEEPKWLYRPDPTNQYILQFDSNRTKAFLMQRLEASPGSSGSLTLYYTPDPLGHDLFAQHVCDSEYCQVKTVRGKDKLEFVARAHQPDNDWLDCLSNCLTMASFMGASLKFDEDLPKSVVGDRPNQPKLTLKEIWAMKRKAPRG